MTHPGQQLSALVDNELEDSKRADVLLHVYKCRSCSDELAALHVLKRRMNALGEIAAGAGLTGQLLSHLVGLGDSSLSGDAPPGEPVWPPPPPPGGWPAGGRPSQDASSASRANGADHRATRFFLAGSVAIFLAGLGTAAVIAGGEPQARAPAPPAAPSIDVLVAPQHTVNPGLTGGGSGAELFTSRSRGQSSFPDVDATSLPGQP